ncbi:MAG: glycosyltransferase [Clostridia bacterium]|nr:glycosyltransferase [Clostridia bacterium]
MKKVLILYAAYGGGHLSAAKSIKECIDNNYKDVDAELIDYMKYISKAIEKISTEAYKEMAKKAPWAWGKMYSHSQKGPFAKLSSKTFNLMSLKLNSLLEEKNPDLIISTHPFSNQMCAYLKKKGKLDSEIATILTDYAPHDQWIVGGEYVDYFFVAHMGMKEELILKGIPAEKIYAKGIPLSNRFLFHYNKEEILESFGLVPGKKTVLFFAGGEFGLGKSKTYEILESFVHSFDNIQIIAIAGKNIKMKKEFEELVKNFNKEASVKILEFTDKVPELMSASDLVVTKPGGLTTTESLASGLPIIVINPIPGQEEENAEFLEKNKVAIWIKKEDNVEQIISDLFNHPEKMQEMKINARLLSKKNSTKDICEVLFGKI